MKKKPAASDVPERTRNRQPNRALTEEQIERLLDAIETIRDDALVRLGLSVGLRVSEVVGIRTSEIASTVG